MIDKYGLLINNKTGRFTRPISQGTLIIDLALFMTELEPLTL